MHPIPELQTNKNHEIWQLSSSTHLTRQQRWKDYLGIDRDNTQFSQDHLKRLALTNMFQNFYQNDRILFHMTVTYKTYKETPYTPKNTNDFFINFYLKCFIPKLLGTRGIHKKRELQPICFSFLDDHESRPKETLTRITYSDRLHHHAILAVHPNTLSRMNAMIGDNKIPLRSRWASKVMTTHIRECEAMTTLYATKKLKKYPEFLSFPDRCH